MLHRYILVFLASCEILRKTIWISAYSSPYQYLSQSDNLIEWPVLASVFAVSFIYSGKTYVWQNHVGAFSVLFAWINLMVRLILCTHNKFTVMYKLINKLILAGDDWAVTSIWDLRGNVRKGANRGCQTTFGICLSSHWIHYHVLCHVSSNTNVF